MAVKLTKLKIYNEVYTIIHTLRYELYLEFSMIKERDGK